MPANVNVWVRVRVRVRVRDGTYYPVLLAYRPYRPYRPTGTDLDTFGFRIRACTIEIFAVRVICDFRVSLDIGRAIKTLSLFLPGIARNFSFSLYIRLKSNALFPQNGEFPLGTVLHVCFALAQMWFGERGSASVVFVSEPRNVPPPVCALPRDAYSGCCCFAPLFSHC